MLSSADCPVVIYGDSSAMTGLDPRMVQKETGLKACNISEYEGIFMLDRTLIPDQYLLHNKRPKVMVFLFNQANLAPYRDMPKYVGFEATLMNVRCFPVAGGWASLLQHPSDTFDFMTRTIQLAARDVFRKGLPEDDITWRRSHQGLYWLDAPQMTVCSPPPPIHDPDAGWIALLRRKYSQDGTRVIVDVTPSPICDKDYDHYAGRIRGLTDNEPERWPLSMFDATGHFTPAGVNRLSDIVARQINH